jgi:hypothetical protein
MGYWDVDLFNPPGGIREGLAYVFLLQVGIKLENIFGGVA